MDDSFDTKRVYVAMEAAHQQEQALGAHLADFRKQVLQLARAYEREQVLRLALEQQLKEAQEANAKLREKVQHVEALLGRWEKRAEGSES